MTKSLKTFLQLFLLTLACTFQACSANRSSSTDSLLSSDSDPIFLWRVTHPQKFQGKHMLIYGTMHVRPKDLAYLDKSVVEGLAQSDRVFFDYDLSQLESLEFLSWLGKESSLPQAVFLRDQISKDLYARLEKAMDKRNFNGDIRESMKKMRPWRAALFLQFYTLESWGMSEAYGSGVQVAALAAEHHKPVSGLLDAMAQFKSLASASPKDQEEKLEKVVDSVLEGGLNSPFRNSEEDTRLLTEIYSRGDYQKLDAYFLSMATDPKSRQYFKTTVSERSRTLAQNIQALTEEKSNPFIAVNLSYLAGPGNILETLRKEGFAIERIPAQGKVDKIFARTGPAVEKDIAGWARVETPLFRASLPGDPRRQEIDPKEDSTSIFYSVQDFSTTFMAVYLNPPLADRENVKAANPKARLDMIGAFIDGSLKSNSTVTSSRIVDTPVRQSLWVEFRSDLGKGAILGFEVDGEFGYLMIVASHSTADTSAIMASKRRFFESLQVKKTKAH